MAYKSNYTIEGHQSNLALFQKPYVDTAIRNVEWIDYRPVSQIGRGSVIEFSVPGTGLNYIDLKRTKLYMKVRITRFDGAPVTNADLVGFVNAPLMSLIKQCDVSLNQTIISPDVSNLYSYRAMLQMLTQISEDAKESQCQSGLYYKDTAGAMDAVEPVNGANFGLIQRYAWTMNGDAVQLEGPICMDIMEQDRLLLNGVQLVVKLYPASDAFVLMSTHTDSYRFEILDTKLRVCSVTIDPAVIVATDAALEKSPALYPFTRSNVKAFSIAQGLLNWSTDDLFLGQVPERVFVALTSSRAFSGATDRNPFNFDNFNVNSVGFYVDGTSQPSSPFTPNYASNEYISEYLSLFQGVGKYLNDEGNYISRDEYKNGYAIYLFDLTSNHSEDIENLTKKGHTRLSIQFAQPLAEATTVIVYAQFPAMVRIDKARNVMVN